MPRNTAVELLIRMQGLDKKPNRLINEKSPYLLQHAFNPVDWYPWGDEAFETAAREQKPVFLSIGYSTCYWCHVMERQVFENDAIAELMNETLICVKVDREERPDIDHIYMTAVQALTGSGGWPMSMFLTPDRKPFFGGTYFPPADAYNRPGFPTLVRRVAEVWEKDREKIVATSDEITDQLKQFSSATSNIAASEYTKALERGASQFSKMYDPVHGGFGRAPKFPRPVAFNFLFRHYARTKDEKSLEIALSSLRKMADGGVYDHLGGGFHRYSVDGEWRVPHFEKMLYDQAQLAFSYLDAYQISQDPAFAVVAKDILRYVERDLTSPDGGFYSAEDAESAISFDAMDEKEEGTFYVWTQNEIDALLTENQASLFRAVFGVLPRGNALHDPQQVFTDKNILYHAQPIDIVAKTMDLSTSEAFSMILEAKQILFEAREKRPRPHLDDKILTAWNGLMISAFARAAQVFNDDGYLSIARKSATFVVENLIDKSTGHLLRRFRDGEARFEGTLQDYSFFIQGLIDLFEASQEIQWLKSAIALTESQISLFKSPHHGGFQDAISGSSELLFNSTEDYDGAEPTGSSISALNLLRLAAYTDKDAWRDLALGVIQSVGVRIEQSPEVVPQMLCALEWLVAGPREVIIADDQESMGSHEMLEEVHRHYVPNKILIHTDGGPATEFLKSYIPILDSLKPQDRKATAFICRQYSCKLPTTDAGQLTRLLTEP